MKYRTILCEDNDSVREIFKYILQEKGHEVLSFKDAGDCPLNFCSECKCKNGTYCSDLIITDVSMPKVDGLEFVSNLKKIGCRIKYFALISGYWTADSIAKAKELDCAIFHKPVLPDELFDWIIQCEKKIAPQRILSVDLL